MSILLRKDSCIYNIYHKMHFLHTVAENPGSALNVCLLRCTHLSCMTSHMKIHIWKACVCVCLRVDNMSGPFCVCVKYTRRAWPRCHSLMTYWTVTAVHHADRVPLCLQEGSRETEKGGQEGRWRRVKTFSENLSHNRLLSWHWRVTSRGTAAKWRTFV